MHEAVDVSFVSRDGFSLNGTLYRPKHGTIDAVAVFAPGIGVSYLRYRHLFEYMCRYGVAVFGFDYRGIGVNAYSSVRDLRRANPGAEEWCCFDLSAAIDFTLDRLSVDKLVGIGHSFGGTAFGLIDNPETISSLVFVSSSSGYLGYYRGLDLLKKTLYMGLLVLPIVKAMGYLPARLYLGRYPLPGKFSRQWASWCFSSDYIKADFNDNSFSALKVPLFALCFHDDSIANESATKALSSLFDGCAVDVTFYTDGKYGHNAILTSRNKVAVWDYVVECVIR